MSTEHFQHIKRIFQSALELDPPARSGFLDASCRGDPGLREMVERMLAADESGDGFLEGPVITSTRSQWSAPPGVGARIGPYLLVRPISSGGMGVV